jgi:hypothetical protein
MKALKLILSIVVLVSIAMVAGCQEEYSRHNNPTSRKKVVWESTTTGFYSPRVTYMDAK